MADSKDNERGDNTITFMMEGDVSLQSFAEGLNAFNKLVIGLTREIAGEIDWKLYELSYSSAIAVIQGNSYKPESVAQVVERYIEVGRKLERGVPIRRTPAVNRSAGILRRIARRRDRCQGNQI